ncbi:MAG: glycosyltransferase family 4 protein [Chloroflexi bacterium]|nr:glycosyltransferase family 4 protein [Chloroflexota bacterium]
MMMRFALDGRYIQDHFPGIGRYTYSLARALAGLLSDETLLLLYDPHVENRHYPLQALLEHPRVEGVQVSAGVFGPGQQWILPKLLGRWKANCYHSPYFVVPYWGRCPMVVTIHDLIPELCPDALPNPRLRFLFRALARRTCRRAQAVLTGSEATRQDLQRLWGVSAERLVTTPYGVDAAFYPRSDAEVTDLGRRLGLPERYVLYVGINKPHKNLVRLIEAWGRVPEGVRKGAELVLAGKEDPRYPEVRQAIARWGLEHAVRMLGIVDDADLPSLYSGALAFVFPSLYEGFGLPVLEAMACGAPVLASERASLSEVVGDAGLTFDPMDVDTLRDLLARLLSDADLRRDLSVRGRARAAEFTWERTAIATLAVYRHVATR